MLCTSRTLDQDRQNQGSRIPLIVLISASDMDRQGCAALIDQNMDLTPHFGAIGGVLPGVLAPQRGWNRLAIRRLPGPANVSGTPIITQHRLHDPNKHSLLSPVLEASVDHTARDTKEVLIDGFPLTAGPQHIPDAIHHRSVVGRWSAPSALSYFGKVLLDLLPQLSGHLGIAHILRLCVRLIQDVPPLFMGFGQHIYNGVRLFIQPLMIFRIGSKGFLGCQHPLSTRHLCNS